MMHCIKYLQQGDTLQRQLNIVKGVNSGELAALTTAPGEGAFALDHSGNLIYINETAEDIIGWTFHELSNKNFFKAVHFKMDAIGAIGTSKCAALHSVCCSHLQLGATLRHRSGRQLPITYISIPVFDDGRMQGKLFVFSEASYCPVTNEDYGAMVENAGSFILRIGLDGRVAYANQIANDVFADRLENVIPTSVRFSIKDNLDKFSRIQHLNNRVKTKDGLIRSVAWAIAPILDNNKNIVGLSCIGNDITEHDSQSKSLQPEKILARRILENISDAVITIDTKGIVEYLNPAAEELTGWAISDARGLLLADVFHVIDKKNRKPMAGFVLRRARDIDLEAEVPSAILTNRNGVEFSIDQTITAERDQQGVVIGGVITFKPTVVLADAAAEMEQSGDYDLITGILSRKQFEVHLNNLLISAKRERNQQALCYVQVNGLSTVTAHHGETASNEFLKQIAIILSGNIRETDALGRLGDATFGVLLSKCSVEDALETAKTICYRMSNAHFNCDGKKVDINISVGLVPISASAGSTKDILRVADVACYVARSKGRNRVHVYKSKDIAIQSQHGEVEWLHKIRSALDENKFRLYCQSIVPLREADKHNVHHEILLRMVEDNGQILRPGAFLSAAEHYYLMPSIDRWVVQNTLNLLQERLARPDQLGVFSINLSAQSLVDDNFLSFVIDQLDKTQVPADRICFEITESTAISNLMRATRFISILKGMGCRFSLDDFGKGFSSYAYLKNLHVDFLKIDGSFVRDLANDAIDHAMVESINEIGHIMGVQTIAEFVETQETLEQLMHLGVDHVQGYQLGKPRPMWPSVNSAKIVQVL